MSHWLYKQVLDAREQIGGFGLLIISHQ